MRLRLAVASFMAMALAGCSFLLSEEFAAEDAPPATEAGATDTTSSSDVDSSPADVVTTDAGADGDAALDPTLVAFWTFDKNTTSSQRDETNRYDLVVSGATIDPDGGIRGGGIVFLGSESPRVEALSGANFPKAGTLSMWFKHAFVTGDLANAGIFDDWEGDRAHVFIRRLGTDAPDRIQVALQPAPKDGGNSNYAWAQGFDAPKDQWTHMVFTWDSVGKTAGLYVNGVVVKASGFISGETFDPSEQSFQISDGFVGSVDEVRLYNRVMPPAEALLLP